MTDGDLRERRNQVRMELKKSETELKGIGGLWGSHTYTYSQINLGFEPNSNHLLTPFYHFSFIIYKIGIIYTL